MIFGAGHVSRALNRVLVGLDCRITCFDTRQEWPDRLPHSPRLRRAVGRFDDKGRWPSGGRLRPADDDGHTTDKPILIELLRQQRAFPYLGVIGSRAKVMRLKKDITEAGLPADAREAFYCPIGLPLGSHHPMEIAISVSAQMLQERDRLWQRQRSSAVGRTAGCRLQAAGYRQHPRGDTEQWTGTRWSPLPLALLSPTPPVLKPEA